MAYYSFTTDRGWKVTEYRAFSPSYSVLHTPGLNPAPQSFYATNTAGYRQPADEQETPQPASGNLLTQLTGQQLKFDYFSEDVLKKLLQERAALRDRNRSAILGRLTDISGDIYAAYQLKSPDWIKQKQGLERTRLDLEKQLRDEDVTLWRDTIELRRELILAARKYAGTRMRTELSLPAITHNDNNQGQGDDKLSG
jgi:hypothetical protein